MYNTYFGFTDSPFENTLDQRFLYLSSDHGEVLAALLYFVKEKKGLAMVCGDVGTGKTMMINCFLNRLPDYVHPITIANPLIDYAEIIQYIARNMGISHTNKNTLELIDDVKEALIQAKEQGKDYVLILDEAHLLSDTSLEHIRLLSNIETSQYKLLHILLVGQYELSPKLGQPGLRQIRQRINISRFLSPLTPSETIQYIDYRLQKVGSSFDACFSANCKGLIYKLTAGIPRQINQLCDNALLICLTEGKKLVNNPTLKNAQEALRTDQIFINKYAEKTRDNRPNKKVKFGIPIIGGLVLLIVGLLLGHSGFFGQISHKLKGKPVLEAGHPLPSDQTSSPGNLQKEKVGDEEAAARLSSGKESKLEAYAPGKPEQSTSPLRATETDKFLPDPPSIIQPSAVAKSVEIVQSGIVGSQTQATAVPEDKSPPSITPLPVKETVTQEEKSNKSNEVTVSQIEESAYSSVPAKVVLDSKTPFSTQIIVEKNNNLTSVARQQYPNDPDLGLVALLLANPQTINEDRISIGQKLILPQINPINKVIQLKEGIFYSYYSRYYSLSSFQQAIADLSKKGVRYQVLNTQNTNGSSSHRIILGAFANMDEVKQAIEKIKTKSSGNIYGKAD
jgi:general secretion pathway protein A